MTLRNRTLLLISLVLVSTLVSIYLISRDIVYSNFQELEYSYARENTNRAMELIQLQLENLTRLTEGYAETIDDDWHPEPDVLAFLTASDLDLYFLFDDDGTLLTTQDNPTFGSRFQVPAAWRENLGANHPLYIPRNSNGQARGIIRLPTGQAAMLASTMLTRQTKGLSTRYTLIFGKILDSAEINRLGTTLKMSLRLTDIQAIPRDSELQEFYRSLTINAPFRIHIRDDEILNGFFLLKDTRNLPIFVAEVTLPRDIFQQGNKALQYFTKLLFLVGFLATVAVAVLIEHLILTRLNTLRTGIARIRETTDLRMRVPIAGADEITELARLFNSLMDGLLESQTALENQIHQRKADEDIIRTNQERFQQAEMIGKLGHWERDEIADRLLGCSQQYAHIFELTVDEAQKYFNSSSRELEMIHPDDREAAGMAITKARESKLNLDIEYRIITACGETRYVHRISEPVIDDRGVLTHTRGTLQDITRQKLVQANLELYQKKLRVLMTELALAEEQERRRIANALHDSTIQNLGLSKFKLSIFQNRIPEEHQDTLLKEVMDTLDQAIKDTRSLVFELSPPVLYELGFVPAIEWLAEQFYLQRGLVCEVYVDAQEKPLDTPMMVSLFQIIRELLINVSKHSRANRAMVLIDRINDRLKIQVQDDGIGMDPDLLDNPSTEPGGFGLFSIRERLGIIGEDLTITSTRGTGTNIVFFAPLNLEMDKES